MGLSTVTVNPGGTTSLNNTRVRKVTLVPVDDVAIGDLVTVSYVPAPSGDIVYLLGTAGLGVETSTLSFPVVLDLDARVLYVTLSVAGANAYRLLINT